MENIILKSANLVLLGFVLIASILSFGCQKEDLDTIAPPESPWKNETIRQATCPKGFEALIPWAQAVHDTRKGAATESLVEVDYFRMWAVVDNKNQLICEDDYNVFDPQSVWFGLYSRHPWFGTDDHGQMPVVYSSGYLILYPNTYPENVWHWWVTKYPRPFVPKGAQRFWVEMKVKITGPALVQIGADFYRTPTSEPNSYNIKEWGISNWFQESPEWQVITAGTPAK